MARVNLPVMSYEAAGSLDNIVFSLMSGTWQGSIQTARSRPATVFNPNTPAQQAVRKNFSDAISFYQSANDKTIGATSFVRSDFLDAVSAIQTSKQYKGVAPDGRQLFIGGTVSQGDVAPSPLLPQDCTTEPELQACIDWSNNAISKALTLNQSYRLGYHE